MNPSHTALLPISLVDHVQIFAKCEFQAPTISIKDRVARKILSTLSSRPNLKHLVVPSSGLLALSLAYSTRQHHITAILPEDAPNDIVSLLRVLAPAVDIVRTPPDASLKSPEHFNQVAKRLVADLGVGAVVADETGRDDVHFEETGAEVLAQSEGRVDAVFCFVETGNTVVGVGKRLKEALPNVRVFGARLETTQASKEPRYAPLPVSRTDLVEEIVAVSLGTAYSVARDVIARDRLLVGVQSGAVLSAVKDVLGRDPEVWRGKRVVVVLPDGARTYADTLLNDEYLSQHVVETPATSSIALLTLGASVEDLQLPEALTIPLRCTVSQARAIMLERDFSQVPVVDSGRRTKGFVTLSMLEEALASGRCTESEEVRAIMIHWGDGKGRSDKGRKREYKLLTPDTSLTELAEFFDHHSFAFITDQERKFTLAVCTKLDLLRFLNKRARFAGIQANGSDGTPPRNL
ncbi:tryptophan synthase beta subunit-like PLP-dependent enzyme [Gonapodya prolifera JEL478]|uniref:Tryptophan synthase beta subunit-like PLP-dependent enzyme n=1 Tax=Gonapodya prolifera (strain JEL478) TaxID=1344416 RepID=A0A139AY10_GONPJ|nr:tryptophan synthase beta subunit-like PLP-dependent enzyme [Gonapodya prolifera JEL478]|eukprot:KXS21600.1 tryptophan synthase beta subunit-like PLP-dependent enzyme [Gonapodya prolifera JEL478]